MARVQKRTPQVEELRPCVQGVAKSLGEKVYGPAGPAWGTTLTQREDPRLEIRAALTEKLLDLSLAEQATALAPRPQPCRDCPGGHQPRPGAQSNPRLVQTRAAQAPWPEPAGYCSRCRRACFPTAHAPGP